MHNCKGRLCDSCRAYVRDLIVQQGKLDPEPRQALNVDEVRNLLSTLADDTTSREMKEHLHSRLLSGSTNKAGTVEKSKEVVKRSKSGTITQRGPESHFSDTSDDEASGASEDLVDGSGKATIRSHVQPHRPAKMTGNDKARLSLVRDKEHHGVFDLEL